MNKKFLVKIMLTAVAFSNILTIFVQFSIHSWFETSKLFDILGNVNESSNQVFDVPEFKYLISKPKCSRNSSAPYFVTLVHSSPTQFERRAACRDTWAHSDPRTKTYFLMGMVQSSSLQKRINEEDVRFNDIIQGNFVDSYRNLTYKHTMALKWFSDNCPHVKYLLKLDDDVFVNVPAVHEYLLNNTDQVAHLHGLTNIRHLVQRRGKWKVRPEEFNGGIYPDFVSGQSIIYSRDFVHEAFKKTFTTPYFWIDDVYVTGIIREELNATIKPIGHLKLNGDNLKNVLKGNLSCQPVKVSKFVTAAFVGYQAHELTDGLMENQIVPYQKQIPYPPQVPYPYTKPEEDDLGANEIVLILLLIIVALLLLVLVIVGGSKCILYIEKRAVKLYRDQNE
ncbi:beta-1,3-galactosyltransferase 5-like [Sitodiplosis mosellana]|uniref:beta-1,3-galactosyltransferase 5-like n=1 Tax=Sitodiplosis mosellana TaxID=263140 RepID=UPI0024452B82|nr:beta-1,3-galactosyltransferase 5-like [Sitodiplosis mosellana]